MQLGSDNGDIFKFVFNMIFLTINLLCNLALNREQLRAHLYFLGKFN